MLQKKLIVPVKWAIFNLRAVINFIDRLRLLQVGGDFSDTVLSQHMKLFGRAIFVGVSFNNNESTPTKGKFCSKGSNHNWFYGSIKFTHSRALLEINLNIRRFLVHSDTELNPLFHTSAEFRLIVNRIVARQFTDWLAANAQFSPNDMAVQLPNGHCCVRIYDWIVDCYFDHKKNVNSLYFFSVTLESSYGFLVEMIKHHSVLILKRHAHFFNDSTNEDNLISLSFKEHNCTILQ